MEKIALKNLLGLLTNVENQDLIDKYKSWRKIDPEDLKIMELIGILEVDDPINEEYNSEINYWDANYPIAFRYYPHSNCEIYKYENGYYMIYKDFGGHAPERRCRFIDKKLIIISQ